MKVLVAGGVGFVGSHLNLRLIQGGHSGFCLVNPLTGRRQNIGDHAVRNVTPIKPAAAVQ